MPEKERSRAEVKLEIFKAISTFLSSVVIAVAGIVITNQYNTRQLEITQKQADSELALARARDISALVPKLGSADAKERRFTATALALHGKSAIPALMAALADDDEDVREASAMSLALIGEAAIPDLTSAYQDVRRNQNQRAMCVRALGLMRAPGAYELASEVLASTTEEPVVLIQAAAAMGYLRDRRSIDALLGVLKRFRNRDVLFLNRMIVWALAQIQIGHPEPALVDPLASLLSQENEDLRYETIWALADTKSERVIPILARVQESDKSERVRKGATDAKKWVESAMAK